MAMHRQNQFKKEPALSGDTLSIDAHDSVQTKELFGDIRRGGVAGTLQVKAKEDLYKMADAAWELSKGTGLPVVLVVRASGSPK